MILKVEKLVKRSKHIFSDDESSPPPGDVCLSNVTKRKYELEMDELGKQFTVIYCLFRCVTNRVIKYTILWFVLKYYISKYTYILFTRCKPSQTSPLQPFWYNLPSS